MDNNKLFNRLIEYLEKKNVYPEYGKIQEYDRYSGDFKNVILGDWNNVNNKIPEFIENKLEHTTLWIDEYTTCIECYNFMRIVHDSYSWQLNGMITEYGYVCRKCIEKDINYLIEEYKNTNNKAIPDWSIELVKNEGYICLDDNENESCKIFENGWYEGQNDHPDDIIKSIEDNLGEHINNKYDYLFAINSVGQFDIHYSLFLKEL